MADNFIQLTELSIETFAITKLQLLYEWFHLDNGHPSGWYSCRIYLQRVVMTKRQLIYLTFSSQVVDLYQPM